MKHRNSVDMLVDALWDGNDMNKPNTVTSNLIRDLMMRAENAEAKLDAAKQWGSVLEYELNKSFPEIYSTNRETWSAIQEVLRQLNELRKVLEGGE